MYTIRIEKLKKSQTDTEENKSKTIEASKNKKLKRFALTIMAIIGVLIFNTQAKPDGLIYQVIIALTWLLIFILSEKLWENFLTGRNLNPTDFNNETRFNEYESKGYSEFKCKALLDADCEDFNKKKNRGTLLSVAMRFGIAVILALLSVYYISNV